MAVGYRIGKVKMFWRNIWPHPPTLKKRKLSTNLLQSINQEVIFIDRFQIQKNFLFSSYHPSRQNPSTNLYLVKVQIRNKQDVAASGAANLIIKCIMGSNSPLELKNIHFSRTKFGSSLQNPSLEFCGRKEKASSLGDLVNLRISLRSKKGGVEGMDRCRDQRTL